MGVKLLVPFVDEVAVNTPPEADGEVTVISVGLPLCAVNELTPASLAVKVVEYAEAPQPDIAVLSPGSVIDGGLSVIGEGALDVGEGLGVGVATGGDEETGLADATGAALAMGDAVATGAAVATGVAVAVGDGKCGCGASWTPPGLHALRTADARKSVAVART